MSPRRSTQRPWFRWLALASTACVLVACAGDSSPPRIPLGSGVGTRQASADALAVTDVAAVRFVLADGLDLPASEADAWRWAAPSPDDVAALADRLGIDGDPVEVPADEGGGWVVGEAGMGSGPSLNAGANGGWWASRGAVPLVVSSDCDGIVEVRTEPASPPGGPVVTVVDDMSDCVAVPDPPAADLPTDEEVLAAASTVFGDDVAAQVDWRDGWSVSVRAEYLVDGRPSGQFGFYGVDAVGWNASGLLGPPSLVGRYPTISAADAVTRLSDPSLGIGMVVEPQPLTEPAVPLPDSLPEPVVEPTDVMLVAAAATLVPFFDGTGAVWSLPGYVYTDADGGEWEVVAVSDDSFDLSPDVPDGVAMDPPVDGDAPVSDVPDGGSDPGGGGAGVVEPFPGDPSTGGGEPGQVATPPDVVGLPEAEATGLLEDAGFSVRVAERDGELFMLTRDYRGDRVNLLVAGGVVTSVWVG